jgi:hypothetical protein
MKFVDPATLHRKSGDMGHPGFVAKTVNRTVYPRIALRDGLNPIL